MALEVLNLGKTVTMIWALLNFTQRRYAGYYVCLSVIATVFEVLSLGLIIPLLYTFTSTASTTNNGILGYVLNASLIKNFNLSYILLLLVLLFSIKNIFFIYLTRFQAKFVFGIEESLSNQIYRIYLNQPYSFFLKNNSAQLLRNVMREPSQFAHNALSPLCLLITELLISTGVVALLIIVNPLGAIYSFLIFGGVGYFFYALAHKKISRWGKEHQFHEGKRLQNLQEGFGSIKEILIGSLQVRFTSQYSHHMHAGSTAGINHQSVQSAPRLLIEIFAVIVLALTFLLFAKSDPASLLPIIGLYAAAAFRLMPSVNRIINALQSLRYSESSVHLLANELSRGTLSISRGVNRKVDFSHSIELKNLSFQYDPTSKMLIKDANIIINKGDLVFLSGPSGVGKTTMVDIICGLQKPSHGEVLVDGLSITACISDWQKHIAYVPQSTFLLDGSIKENIIFGGNEVIDYARLKEVCRIACVDQIVEALPGGLDAFVGERGSNLSGGQRQRIGIARALYRGGSLLILDEATNALDGPLEKFIMQEIFGYANENKSTILCISHNLGFIAREHKKINFYRDNISIQSIVAY